MIEARESIHMYNMLLYRLREAHYLTQDRYMYLANTLFDTLKS